MEGLKMPSLDDYKNCNFETEAERYEAYAYALKNYSESLEKHIDKIKSKNIENLEFVKEEITRAYELSKKATNLRNQFHKIWFSNFTPSAYESRQMISIINDQLQVLWALNRILVNLIMDFDYDFKFNSTERMKGS
jgi:hypothetical protein